MVKNVYRFPNTDRIRELIEAQGLKKYWVAEQAGVHKTTLYRWFSGRTVSVREHNLIRMASVLLTDVGELIRNDRNHNAA